MYSQRFSDEEAARKDALWKEICRYLQRHVPEDGAVLDLACDRGDFIRNIRARERWGSDVRDVGVYLGTEVQFVQADGLRVAEAVPVSHFDLVFMSNYLEHLPSGDHVIAQLEAVAQILKPGGCVMILQPNIRLTGEKYWDFIDHKVALTHESLDEAARLAGFTPEVVVRRFLPFTTKGALPTSPRLAALYLRVRPAWLLLGEQTLYVGRAAGA